MITDKKGVSWYEIPIKKEWAKIPVEAFGAVPFIPSMFNQDNSKQQ